METDNKERPVIRDAMAQTTTQTSYETRRLFDALYAGNEQAVSDALYDGADVNACEPTLSGYTPLTLAFEFPCDTPDVTDRIVRQLVVQGANIHLANAWGTTPLLAAVAAQKKQWAMDFLAQGADPNARGIVDGRLTSALHEAAYNCDIEMIEWLFQAGVDKNLRASRGLRADAYARKNRANSPIALAQAMKAFNTKPHPILSRWRAPVQRKYAKWDDIDFLERTGTNWTAMCLAAVSKKDWHKALLAAELGAYISTEMHERIREKRYCE